MEDLKTPESAIENANKAKVLVMGTFKPGEIVLSETGEKLLDNPDVIKQIADRWDDKWFPGPLVRLETFSLDGDILNLKVGQTNFREYVGTRDLKSLRTFGAEALANPVSLSTVVVTTDNKIVVANKSSGDKVGSIDAPGGYMHPNRDRNPKTGRLDVFKAALEEIAEEIFFGHEPVTNKEFATAKEFISEQLCLGLSYEYANLCHPVLSFAMRTNLSSSKLQERIKEINQLPNCEIKATIVNPEKDPNNKDVEYVYKLLSEHYPQVEPDGRVTIALARKWLAGVNYPKQQLKGLEEV